MRLTAIYGHKFASLFPTEEVLAVAKAEWSQGLAGLSDFQLSQGFDRCKILSEWNPNIPEFLRFATNLPSMEVAIHRAIKGEILDPVTRRLCVEIGPYDMKRKIEKELRKQLSGIYPDIYETVLQQTIGRTENWKPPVQIEQKEEEEQPVNREVGYQELKKMKRIIEENKRTEPTRQSKSVMPEGDESKTGFAEDVVLEELKRVADEQESQQTEAAE